MIASERFRAQPWLLLAPAKIGGSSLVGIQHFKASDLVGKIEDLNHAYVGHFFVC